MSNSAKMIKHQMIPMDTAIGTLSLVLADGFWLRLRGLLGVRCLPAGYGMVLSPCGSIHTLGMQIPLAVICLNDKHQVLKVVKFLAPNRLLVAPRGTKCIVELSVQTPNIDDGLIGQIFF